MQIKGSHEKSIAASDYQAWLFYGPDQGRVSDLAVTLQGKYRAKGLDHLTVDGKDVAKDPRVILDQVGSAGLFSPGTVLRIREGDDKAAKSIEAALDAGFPDGRLIIEAGELTAASKLKKLFEGRADCALAACWEPTRSELKERAKLAFQSMGRKVEEKALDLIAELSPPDSGAIIRECQKLAVQAGDDIVTVATVEAGTADLAEAGFSDVGLALCDGRPDAALTAYWRLVNVGEAPMGILRIVGRHVARLHDAAVKIAAGASADTAMASLRPPVFWKEKDSFKRQATVLKPRQLEQLMNVTIAAERQTKSGGNEEYLVGQALLSAALEVKKWRNAS